MSLIAKSDGCPDFRDFWRLKIWVSSLLHMEKPIELAEANDVYTWVSRFSIMLSEWIAAKE